MSKPLSSQQKQLKYFILGLICVLGIPLFRPLSELYISVFFAKLSFSSFFLYQYISKVQARSSIFFAFSYIY